MDTSQNSDVFLTNIRIFNSPPTMDSISYESHLSKVKVILSKDVENELKESNFSLKFTSLIEDCNTCISQCLDLVVSLLEDTSAQIKTCEEYIEDAVCILQMLYNFMQNVTKSVTMTCVSMKTFPIVVGHIILTVFTHCKDSESLYGSNLNRVERQLKELFRSCHELQQTYIMILEKHFIFDLSHKEQLDILFEALDINLQIGEVVQTLDVKTMAEQWKAYTIICEKYSTHMINDIFEKSSKIICMITENNIRTAREASQDDKIIIRSLKVASFTIRILMKICNIFKNVLSCNYTHVVDLFIYIYMHSSDNFELKSEMFTNLTKTNIMCPSETLLSELLLHEKFLHCMVQFGTRDWKRKEKILGYILLIVSVIQCYSQRKGDQPVLHVYKPKLLNCIFNNIEYCHAWFSMGLKLSSPTEQSYGLYEHVLAHTVVLAATLNSDQYIELERNMYESLLDTECWKALFASDLWVLLARYGSRQLLLNQVITLCNMYKTLENLILFRNSPQNTHISYTLGRLFKMMPNEDKVRVHEQFSVTDENVNLYIALKIKHLPENIRYDVEEIVMESLVDNFNKILTSGFHSPEELGSLTKTLRLTATCSLPHNEESVREYVMKGWEKACPRNYDIITLEDMHAGNLWYFDYVDALIYLTDALEVSACDTESLLKVLHVLSNIIQTRNTELKLALINLLCKLSCYQIHDENITYSFLIESYKKIFQDTDELLRNKLCNTLKLHLRNRNLKTIISKIFKEDSSLEETWKHYLFNDAMLNNIEWKEQYFMATDFKYIHKCIENKEAAVLRHLARLKEDKNSCSSNFDLADIDTLFENDNTSEPACKKPKIENVTDQIENIISRIEEDAEELSKIKESVSMSDYKNRVMGVCQKLKNIVS